MLNNLNDNDPGDELDLIKNCINTRPNVVELSGLLNPAADCVVCRWADVYCVEELTMSSLEELNV